MLINLLRRSRTPSQARSRFSRFGFRLHASLEELEPRYLLAATVELAADINTSGDSWPTGLIAFQDDLYFIAVAAASEGPQWWRLGGDGAVTFVNDLVPRVGGAVGNAAIVFNDELYVGFSNAFVGSRIWKIDSHGEFQPALHGDQLWLVSNPRDFTIFHDAIYFAAGASNARELWRLDAQGEHQQIKIVDDGSPEPEHLTVLGDSLYFSAQDATHGRELWRLDSNGRNRRPACG